MSQVSTILSHPLARVAALGGLAAASAFYLLRTPKRHYGQTGQYKSFFASAPSKEHAVLDAVLSTAKEGDPSSVVDTIDRFAYNNWMMNLGDAKGTTLDDMLTANQPKLMLELGAYCGYSAVRAGRLLASDSLLLSIEMNALCCAIASKVVDHAGLSSRVRVLFGDVASALPRVRATMAARGVKHVDLIFVDHDKGAYLPDLLKLEAAGVIRRGTVIVADNVITPGAPDFLAYVRAAPHYRTRFVPGHIEYTTDVPDGIEICECVADPASAPRA
eukprot:m.231068 g.231068  ORF g.231068 m.231068 type:complete len:274 (-) comp18231_c0_seq1:38-859(-)